MANLYTGSLLFTGYKTVEELTNITFTKGNKYVIQIQNPCYVREGTEGDGFLVTDSCPFEYIAGDDVLYFGTPLRRQIIVNIAEG